MPYGGNNLPPSLAPIARSQNQGYQIRGAASQGSNAVLRTAISNAAGHAPNNNTPMPPQSCSRVASATGASGVGQMNINTSQAAAAHAANTQAILQAPVWNPSMGPSPSIMPSGQKIPTNPATNMSNMSQAQPITANQICKTFPRDAKYFKLDSYSPNTSASKNCDATKFVKQGVYDPIEATYMHKPFDENTAIHITGGTKVSCIDDIAFCGRVNPNSYKELVKLWENLANAAKRQAY